MKRRDQIRMLLAETEALIESIKFVYAIDEKDTNKGVSFSSHIAFAKRQRDLAGKITKEIPGAQFYVFDIDKMKGSFDSLYSYRRNIFDGVLIELHTMRAFLQSTLTDETEELENVTNLIKTKLRSATHQKPQKEIEVQNNIENLLIARNYTKGIDYDRETGRVKTGIKESVPDFMFDRLNFCIEVKLVKENTNLKEIVEQINADIQAYGKRYGSMLFVVYDAAGAIQNEDEFKSNIVEKGRILMEVVKH